MHRQFEHGASTSISYITHAFVHGRSSRGYTFEACVIGVVRVRCGVGEVDVLGTVIAEVVVHGLLWEVVLLVATVVEVVVLSVLGDGGGTSDLGDGSRSRS